MQNIIPLHNRFRDTAPKLPQQPMINIIPNITKVTTLVIFFKYHMQSLKYQVTPR